MELKKISPEELQAILTEHKKWIASDGLQGRRAELWNSDLRNIDLRNSDLRNNDLRDSDLRNSYLRNCDMRNCCMLNSDLRGCNLRHSDLWDCDLRGCDLFGADMDYSCLPLWCGSLDVHFDDRHIIQMLYHVVRNAMYSKNVSPDVKNELAKMIDLANRFHRAEECGYIKKPEEA